MQITDLHLLMWVIMDLTLTLQYSEIAILVRDTCMVNLMCPPPKQLHSIPPGQGELLPHCLVGDEAFPLQSDLLRPYPKGQHGTTLEADKLMFNYRLSRVRHIVENAFGILAQRFRVYDRGLTSLISPARKLSK